MIYFGREGPFSGKTLSKKKARASPHRNSTFFPLQLKRWCFKLMLHNSRLGSDTKKKQAQNASVFHFLRESSLLVLSRSVLTCQFNHRSEGVLVVLMLTSDPPRSCPWKHTREENCENALKTDNTFTPMRSVSTPLRVLRGIQPMNNAPLWKRLWCIYSKEKKKCYFFFKTPRISNSKFSLLFLNNHWVILLVFPFRPLPQRSLLMPTF